MAAGFLRGGGGEMGRLIGAQDWSQTALGPVETWPQSLRLAVEIMLSSRYPMLIWWGSELVQLYNDAYVPVMGKRHPWGLGRPAPEIWPEAWPTVGPLAESVMRDGVSTWNERLQIVMTRNGYPEEVYMTFSYSPISGEQGDGVGGLFCTCTEETPRVLGERRLRTLGELAEATARARTTEEACEAATAALDENALDLPFALLYLLDGEQRTATLAGLTGHVRGTPAAPARIGLATGEDRPWPLGEAIRSGKAVELRDVAERLGPVPSRAWPEAVEQAVILPLARPGQGTLAGLLVAGVSPRLVLDDGYRTFLDLLARQVATAISNARAYEEERQRAEALAEIDRAKTRFFSNVSHEFRTPLTLMLGPLEEVLARPSIAGEDHRRLTVAHRNGLRLLRLVNALLGFSRVEAGRARARYEPTDLAALTAELASSFRSACEAAGLVLAVDCPPLPEPVFVDHGMWDKVVLNLVSNAFKFTFDGKITVAVRAEGGQAVLAVRDTGTGIPEGELPRVFERFHRVENARGRTHEGTGIGLALVQELVRLHGGAVEVESTVGQGTAFTVRLPFGTADLSAGRIEADRTLASTATRAEAFVEEALRWLPDGEPAAAESIPPQPALPASAGAERPCVLLAEDNADMRDYVRRLLGARYDVDTATDGEAALRAVERRRPDLLLADVMMPRLDGLGLLRAVRARPDLQDLPVVLLSARAGEEAKVEGLDAGADDYVVKPFGAQELLARVAATLGMARLRRQAAKAVRESEARLRALVTATSYVVYRMSPDWREMRGLEGRGVLADTEGPSRAWLAEYIHPDDQPRVWETIETAIRTRSVFELEHRVRRADGGIGWTLSRAVPLLGPDGEVTEWFGAASDVTEQKREAVEALRESRERLRTLVEGVPQLVWRAANGGDWTWASPQWTAYTGQPEPESHGRGWLDAVHPEDRGTCLAAWRGADVQGAFRAEHRLRHAGEDRFRWVQSQALPVRGAKGRIVEWLGTTTDIEDLRRQHEERILISELQHRTRNLLTVVSGVADQTLAASASFDEFGARFDQRLAALGRVQGLLSREVAPNVTVDELLRLELAAHGVDADDARRVRLAGPRVALPARAVQLLALALHELMTNAVKHGAFGNEGGRLAISWQERAASGAGGGTRLRLDWAETGVNSVAAAAAARHRGFGLNLIEFTLPYELDGETRLEFTEGGVRCAIELPLDGGGSAVRAWP